MQLTRRFSLNLYLVKDSRVRGTVLHVFRAPSKARLYRLRVSPSSRSFGKALDIECCVGVGHGHGEAYTERWRAAMRKREGIEPRYWGESNASAASRHEAARTLILSKL